jgi:hypothetical protein
MTLALFADWLDNFELPTWLLLTLFGVAVGLVILLMILKKRKNDDDDE